MTNGRSGGTTINAATVKRIIKKKSKSTKNPLFFLHFSVSKTENAQQQRKNTRSAREQSLLQQQYASK